VANELTGYHLTNFLALHGRSPGLALFGVGPDDLLLLAPALVAAIRGGAALPSLLSFGTIDPSIPLQTLITCLCDFNGRRFDRGLFLTCLTPFLRVCSWRSDQRKKSGRSSPGSPAARSAWASKEVIGFLAPLIGAVVRSTFCGFHFNKRRGKGTGARGYLGLGSTCWCWFYLVASGGAGNSGKARRIRVGVQWWTLRIEKQLRCDHPLPALTIWPQSAVLLLRHRWSVTKTRWKSVARFNRARPAGPFAAVASLWRPDLAAGFLGLVFLPFFLAPSSTYPASHRKPWPSTGCTCPAPAVIVLRPVVGSFGLRRTAGFVGSPARMRN